ncbi:MAG: hypothetical protein UX04_C0002G0221 [Microgenomates group bacterium GW2011_GWF2_45_18]|nr:MAG: hypothetical protein UW18_C0003G0341 [Microgenomates group bacterium GW2011_GWF1_44_10]KKU02078.1 MAG: hypothetical protein UX04_C0002G0221 [Microgenomates group bacterium GW2011_GWF2_45_18]HAU98631.1 hypothetical protein [Candidatus Paceibacterota bacterium]HAX01498.1 hypothetical protein [Candidatus Paceibacterota bacterium]
MSQSEQCEDSVDGHLEQVQRALAEFRDKFAITFIVSISGGADEHDDFYVRNLLEELIAGLRYTSAAILTGGTKGGIPEMGIEIAKAHGLPTIGVFPPKGKKYALLDQLDLPIETLPPSVGPASFGSETPTFAQIPDYAVFVGGSYGTLAEVSTMLKVNAKRQRDGAEPIYILPIFGSDGVADLIPLIVQKLDPNLAYCLPGFEITSGKDAAEFINNNQKKKS